MTWTIIIFDIVMLVWLILGGPHSVPASTCELCIHIQSPLANLETMQARFVTHVVHLWIAGDIILGVLWIVTRGRECPACGLQVPRGVIACEYCGWDVGGGSDVEEEAEQPR